MQSELKCGLTEHINIQVEMWYFTGINRTQNIHDRWMWWSLIWTVTCEQISSLLWSVYNNKWTIFYEQISSLLWTAYNNKLSFVYSERILDWYEMCWMNKYPGILRHVIMNKNQVI